MRRKLIYAARFRKLNRRTFFYRHHYSPKCPVTLRIRLPELSNGCDHHVKAAIAGSSACPSRCKRLLRSHCGFSSVPLKVTVGVAQTRTNAKTAPPIAAR